MNEQKINIIAKSDESGVVTVLQGKHTVTLNDISTSTFMTSCADSFLRYIEGSPDLNLYCDITSRSVTIKCFDVRPDNRVLRHDAPLARLDLCLSIHLSTFLDSTINRFIPLAEISTRLKKFARFGGDSLAHILVFARECSGKFVTQFNHSEDNYGNYSINLSRNTEGSLKTDFPGECTFNIPLFEGYEDRVSIKTENFISSEQGDKSISINIKLECIDINDLLIETIKAVLLKALFVSCKNPILFGELKINGHLDHDLIHVLG